MATKQAWKSGGWRTVILGGGVAVMGGIWLLVDRFLQSESRRPAMEPSPVYESASLTKEPRQAPGQEVAPPASVRESALPTPSDLPVAASGDSAIDVSASYLAEMAGFLSTFLTDEPEVLGWNGLLEVLAARAVLDPTSVVESEDGLRGTFMIPNSTLRIEFTIQGEGYKVDLANKAGLLRIGETEFSSSLTFKPEDGMIKESASVVQFHPQGDQRFYEDGPIGYVFGTNEKETFFRPLHGEVREGKYWLEVPPPSENKVRDVSDLGSACQWYARLEEVKQSRPARGSGR